MLLAQVYRSHYHFVVAGMWRLANAPISFDAKFPVLLTKRSQFLSSYTQYLYESIACLESKCLRNLQSDSTVMHRRFKCKLHLMTKIMGDLPLDLFKDLVVSAHSSFISIIGHPTGRFVCFTSKVVHLEVCFEVFPYWHFKGSFGAVDVRKPFTAITRRISSDSYLRSFRRGLHTWPD